MFDTLSLPILLLMFAGSAGVIWLAGIRLSDATDILATRLHLGQALGGGILLAIATNLPEIAITTSAAAAGHMDVAVGNILGGIAIQTVVLVLLDRFGMREQEPLTYRAASLTLVIEGLLVIGVLIVAIMATQLPASMIVFRLTPGSVCIAMFWLFGMYLVARADRGLPWHETSGNAPDAQRKPKGHSRKAKEQGGPAPSVSTAHAATIFLLAAAVTLVCGVLLERTGQAIASHIGMSGMLFGATVLAAATALPEVSTGFASIKLDDYQLAVSDIFGGNAFLPVLFLLAVLISGQAVLPHAGATDIYLAALGILLTCIYIAGLIFRPRHKVAGMGLDSLAVLVTYLVGMLGFFAIAHG